MIKLGYITTFFMSLILVVVELFRIFGHASNVNFTDYYCVVALSLISILSFFVVITDKD
jgi:hypothetical protein